MDECVVEFWKDFFQSFGGDAMFRQELEVCCSGFAQGRRIDTKTTQVSEDETLELARRNVEASKHVLSVSLKSYAIFY